MFLFLKVCTMMAVCIKCNKEIQYNLYQGLKKYYTIISRFEPSHSRCTKSKELTSVFWLLNLYVALKKVTFKRIIIQRYYTDSQQTSDVCVQFPWLLMKVYVLNLLLFLVHLALSQYTQQNKNRTQRKQEFNSTDK